MYNNYWRLNKKGQELPGWTWIIALILGLFALGILIWIAVKGGQTTVKQIIPLK